MNDQLRERLLLAGVSDSEASDIAKSFGSSASDETVDVDRLTKAMEGIRDQFSADDADDADDDFVDVDAAIQEASDIVDAVTKGADVLLGEMREQNELLRKGILAIGDEVKGLREQISTRDDIVQKSLSNVTDTLSAPMAPKSIQASTADVIPAPGDESGGGSQMSLIAKALKDLPDADVPRGLELRKAITLLESGANPAEVAENYHLSR